MRNDLIAHNSNKSNKNNNPRYDVDRLYITRKEGGRGLDNFKNSFDALIQRLEDEIEKVRRKTDYNH